MTQELIENMLLLSYITTELSISFNVQLHSLQAGVVRKSLIFLFLHVTQYLHAFQKVTKCFHKLVELANMISEKSFGDLSRKMCTVKLVKILGVPSKSFKKLHNARPLAPPI